MTHETIQIPITRYRDRDDKPTCAVNFVLGTVCSFYMTQRLGANETCVFADKAGRFWQTMRRRAAGEGSLMPLKQCPVWADRKDEL